MVSAPIGYETPSFPSLYWPLGPSADNFHSSFLYHTKDVWEFTTVWTMIFMTGVYTASACLILITHYVGSYRNPLFQEDEVKADSHCENNVELHEINYNHIYEPTKSTYHHYFVNPMLSANKKVLIFTAFTYIIIGAFQGFVAGSIVGVLIAAIYNAAQFKVTTWIPFVYSLVITLYNIASSYSFTVKSL